MGIKEFRKLLKLDDSFVPEKTHVHRWLYSDMKEYLQIDDGFILDIQTKIGMCGDWCNNGRVEGAYLSGYLLS